MTQNDPKPKTSQNQPKGDLKSSQNDPRRSKTRKTEPKADLKRAKTI